MDVKIIIRFTLFCAICSAIILNNVIAHQIKFEHLTTEEGLSHSWVTCIYQDNPGFMWFGTFDGLNKFDGYDFFTYRHNLNDPNSLPLNIIRSICEDDSENLWIATTQGICLYDRRKDIFINYNKGHGYNLENTDVWNIFHDSQAYLWIGTNYTGLYRYDPIKNQMSYYFQDQNDTTSISNSNSNSNSNVRQIFEDSKSNLWIATDMGLSIFNRETNNFNQIMASDLT